MGKMKWLFETGRLAAKMTLVSAAMRLCRGTERKQRLGERGAEDSGLPVSSEVNFQIEISCQGKASKWALE